MPAPAVRRRRPPRRPSRGFAFLCNTDRKLSTPRARLTLEFARTAGKAGGAEDQDVLVDDQVPGLAAGAGLADVVELEERRAGDQPLAAEPGEQRDAPLGRDQPGGRAGGEDGAGQVDQLAALPPGPGGDHHGPAGAQQLFAAGEDLGEPGEQVLQAVAGEVGGVVAVAVVVLLDPAAAGAPAGAGDVRGGDARPPGLVLDADGVAAQVDGLDQGGADAAHRVGDQVPGLAVA